MSVGLTHAHKLLLHRRRSGFTQAQAARRHKVSPAQYAAWEAGTAPIPPRAMGFKLGALSAHEKCLLYRLKTGKTQEECARGLGVSRYWFNQMETGKVNCDTLVWFWEQ